MTILGTFDWSTPPDYLIERSAFWGICAIWWQGCVIQAGRDLILREIPFGGYRVRLTVNEDLWNHTSSGWKHDEVFENLYAMAPADNTPISVGACKREVRFFPSLVQYVVVVQFTPNNDHYRFQGFPFAPENAGSPNAPSNLPSIFFGDLDHPGQILPPTYC